VKRTENEEFLQVISVQTDRLIRLADDLVTMQSLDDDSRTIEKDLDDTAGYMKSMHAVELTNADEPDTIFFTEGGPR